MMNKLLIGLVLPINLSMAEDLDLGFYVGPYIVFNNYPEFEIVSTLSTKLTWSHFVELLPIQDKQKRDFYAEMCSIDTWSVRKLR